jgi:hypothetical protein
MARRAWASATALVTSLAMIGSAEAGSTVKCAKANEVTAIQAAAIQQELMVAALTCNQVANFNAFQIGFNAELRASDATLQKMFKRLYGGGQGTSEYHAFKTRLANDSSIRSIHDNATYCHLAADIFSAALAAERPTFAAFVSGVQVTDDSPISSCELRVAATLKPSVVMAAVSAPPAVIVPKPNPLRVAMLTPPAQPAAAQPVQATPVPLATDTAAKQPEKKPEEKKSGWLSSIFN